MRSFDVSGFMLGSYGGKVRKCCARGLSAGKIQAVKLQAAETLYPQPASFSRIEK